MSKRACVLTGEGARGVWQAACLNHFNERYDLIIGVSSGALNAAGWSILGPDLLDLWLSINKITDVFELNPCFLWQSGFMQADPLIRKLRGAVLEKQFSMLTIIPTMDVATSDIDYHSFAVGEQCNDIGVMKIAAAGAIPGLVRDISGRLDAGMRVLCPLSLAIDLGCDDIDIVSSSAPFAPPKFPKIDEFMLMKSGVYAARAVELLLFEIMSRDIERALNVNTAIENGKSNKRTISIRCRFPAERVGWHLGFDKLHEMSDMKRYPPMEITLR